MKGVLGSDFFGVCNIYLDFKKIILWDMMYLMFQIIYFFECNGLLKFNNGI